MKPHLKKLRTCTYSKDVAASFFGQTEQHTNKLVCDHPVMKINWTEKVCGPCEVYVNRNASLEMPRPAPQPVSPPEPEPATPMPPVQPGTIVESPKPIQPAAAAVESPAEHAAAMPSPATAPARSAVKEKVLAKKTKASAGSKTTAPTKKAIKVTKGKPTTTAKKTESKTKKK